MRLVEIILVLLSGLFGVMKVMEMPGGVVLTTLSLFLLSVLYLLFGFALFNGIRFRNTFKAVNYQGIPRRNIVFGAVCGLVLSLGLFSILFNLMQWGGAGLLRYVLIVPLLTVAIFSIFLPDRESALRRNAPLRAVPIFLLDLFFIVWYYVMF